MMEFFDSYGHSPGYYTDFFITFIKQFKTVDYSDKHLQSNYSNICGLYCLFYFMLRLKNISLVDIVNMFLLLTFLEMMFLLMMLCPTYFVIV